MNLFQSKIAPNEKYESIKPLLRQFNAAIAGGAARQLYLNDNSFGSTDVDLYFRSDKDKSLLRKCLSKVAKEKKASEYARTFSYKGLDLQIVESCYKDIESLFSTYAFYCCMFFIKNNIVWYTKEAAEDVVTKTLREHYWDSKANPYLINPRAVKDYRILKYVLKKGYEPGTEYLKTRFDYLIKEFLKNGKDEYIDAWLEGKYFQQGIKTNPIDFDDLFAPQPGAIIRGAPPFQWNVHWGAVQAFPINPQRMQDMNAAVNAMNQDFQHVQERIINNNNDALLRPGNFIPDGEQQD